MFIEFYNIVLVEVQLPTIYICKRLERFISSHVQYLLVQRLRWSRGSVLAFGTQVRGVFRANKSSARLPSEGK